MTRSGLPHPTHDRLRDDVARGEIGHRVLGLHEPRTVRVAQERPLAANRLRDERLLTLGQGSEPHDRRMELHELEVCDVCARPHRQRDPVARRDVRIRRLAEDLPEPAGGEYDIGGERRAYATSLTGAHDVEGDALGGTGAVEEQVEHERILHELDAGIARHRSDQGPGNLGPGRIATRMRDSIVMMAALTGERDGARRISVEPGTECDELPQRRWALRDEDSDRLLIAQPDARHQGVG